MPQVDGYLVAFRTLPDAWASQNHEGEIIEALGGNGPVYSIEMNEHLVNSGWVRLLAPSRRSAGVCRTPGSELPIVQPARLPEPGTVAPDLYPSAGQGFSVLLSPDANQTTYVPLLQQLYPRAEPGDGGGDGRICDHSAALGSGADAGRYAGLDYRARVPATSAALGIFRRTWPRRSTSDGARAYGWRRAAGIACP